jgi:hypothetical protein
MRPSLARLRWHTDCSKEGQPVDRRRGGSFYRGDQLQLMLAGIRIDAYRICPLARMQCHSPKVFGFH